MAKVIVVRYYLTFLTQGDKDKEEKAEQLADLIYQDIEERAQEESHQIHLGQDDPEYTEEDDVEWKEELEDEANG